MSKHGGTRRGKSEMPHKASPAIGAHTESYTAMTSPADQKSYPYKRSSGDPRKVSDGVATAPVSMAPKRQVRAGGETPSVSDSVASTPVSPAPRTEHNLSERAEHVPPTHGPHHDAQVKWSR